jgi:hypothetical protein
MQRLVAGVLVLVAPVCLRSQPTLPMWLLAYPGAHIVRSNLPAVSAASFTTADASETVVDYYRHAFESEGLVFAAKSNRFTTMIRADADCGELSISVMKKDDGSSVQLNCRVKFQPQVPKSTGNYGQDVTNMMEAHRQAVAALGIGRELPPAPAPPLEWPAWLTRAEGGLPTIYKGSDPAYAGLLKAEYASGLPMSKLFAFYKDLLSSNGYQIDRGYVQTGQTFSGVQQNADGVVEGNVYPDGFPGPYIEIRVRFSRNRLNDPIRVTIGFRTQAYAGRKALVR